MIMKKIRTSVDKLLEYSLYGIIFFIPMSIAVINIFLSFALFFFVVKKIIDRDFRFLKNKVYIFLALFICFISLSLLNSGIYFEKSSAALIFKWLESMLMFLVIHDTFATNPQYLRNAIRILIAITVLVVIDGLFQQFAGIDFLRLRELPRDGMCATFKNRNDFGAYLVPNSLLVAALLLNHQLRKQLRLNLLLFLLLLVICLILTFSRGAWLGFFAGLLLLIVFLRKKKVILAMLPIILIFILMSPLRQRINLSDAFRFTIWDTAVSMIKENPFLGKGLGTFMDYFSKYPTGINPHYAHNCFLQIWAEAGIFSLISFLLFVGFLLYTSVKKVQKNKDLVLLGLVIGISGFLVHSFFDTQLYSVQLRTLFWMWMGLIAAMSSTNQVQSIGDAHK